VIYAAGDVRDYRGVNPISRLTPMGHEYVGIVEQVGDDVQVIKPGNSSSARSWTAPWSSPRSSRTKYSFRRFWPPPTSSAPAGSARTPPPSAQAEPCGDSGVAQGKDLTDGLGAHSVIEAVGTQESMMQAIRSTRPGGHVGYVGVSHGVELPGEELFYSVSTCTADPHPCAHTWPS
jgi:threonine dehydrogenase-like Zn-dependent dehydrogenase